jgi:hypothetical protein
MPDVRANGPPYNQRMNTQHIKRIISGGGRLRALFATLAVLTVAAIVVSTALGSGTAKGRDPLDPIRSVTAKFRNVDRATTAGYVQFFGCVHEPLAGAMGMHFVNKDLVGDTALDVDKPEALMYEMRPNGTLQLLGVEYIVFQEAWDAANPAPPQMFGQDLNLVTAPNRYGIPAFYEVHAWAWKANPTGAHMDWNPKVLCPATEGHTHDAAA